MSAAMKALRAPDEVRTLATRLLAHLGRDDGWQIEPGAWVLGEWRFTPVGARPRPRLNAAAEYRAPLDERDELGAYRESGHD